MNQIIRFLLCVVVFIIVDAPYLYFNNSLYKNTTLSISNKGYTKRYYSVFIVYFALALGIIVFVLPYIQNSITSSNNNSNSNIQNRIKNAFIYGGIFGLVSYATFDFTMHFMFDKWSIWISIMDTLWGIILCSIVAFCISF